MRRNTLVLLVIFVVLAAFVYFYEYMGGQQREKAKEWEASLFKINKNEVESVTLIREGKETVTYVRGDDDNWRITSPVRTEADKSAVNGNISSFRNAKIKKSLKTTVDKMTNFGLDPPRAEVVVETQKGEEKHLSIGNETATRGDVFAAWKDSTTVLVTSKVVLTQAEKSLFDIRDKKIAHFDVKRVQRLELTSEEGEVILEKSGSDWVMVSPHDVPADASRVRSFLNTLNNSRATEFVEEEFDVHDEEYGFGEPSLRATMNLGQERATKEIVLGKEVDEKVYGYESGRSPLFRVRKSTKNNLSKKPFYFQDKKILKFNKDNLTEIRFSGTYQWTLLKQDTLGWYAHGDSTIRIEDSQMKKLFGHLRNLTSKDLVTYEPGDLKAYGLRNPMLEVTLLSGKEEVGGFAIGDGIEKDRYVKVMDYPFVYLIAASQVDRVTKWLDQMVESE